MCVCVRVSLCKKGQRTAPQALPWGLRASILPILPNAPLYSPAPAFLTASYLPLNCSKPVPFPLLLWATLHCPAFPSLPA